MLSNRSPSDFLKKEIIVMGWWVGNSVLPGESRNEKKECDFLGSKGRLRSSFLKDGWREKWPAPAWRLGRVGVWRDVGRLQPMD
jgi:hypothetical protein